MSELEVVEGVVTKLWPEKEFNGRWTRTLEIRGEVDKDNKPIKFSCWPFEKDSKSALNRIFGDIQEGDRIKFDYTIKNGYYNINPKEAIEIIEHGVKPEDTGRIAQQQLSVDQSRINKFKERIEALQELQPLMLMETCIDNALVMYKKKVADEVKELIDSDPHHMENVVKLAACLSVLACKKRGI